MPQSCLRRLLCLFVLALLIIADVGGSVTLASAAEHARQYNETVIGYSTASGKMVLAPEASHMIPLEDDCRLVSFAADFNVSKAKSA